MAYTFKYGDRPIEGLTIQRAIGRGGFGEVYYAVADSGKQVALKYLRENPEIELRGIGHVMNLKSPHLITIYDVKKNDTGEPFVIMEYVSGPSLRDLLLAEPGGMPPEKAAFLLRGICAGLSYLHERGIVHRDLKPANIFYDDGYVKIGDYGLAKHISVSKHSGQTVSVGTVHYMAPEIGSGSYTKAIDIYALGIILYEMLTGRLPFAGSSMGEVLMRHLRDEPDLSGIPAAFAKVIAKALQKDPAQRQQDADELLSELLQSAEFSAGADSFDASALTQIPPARESTDPDATLTTPPARPVAPPPLDAREPAYGSPLPPPLQARLDRLAQKMQQKAAGLEQRFGPGATRSSFPPHAATDPPAVDAPAGGRRAQLLIHAAVAIGIAVVLSFIIGGSKVPEQAVALTMFIAGATAGPLLVHLKLLRSSMNRSVIVDRLAYAALAALFMAPGIGLAYDELHNREFARIALAPIVALVLCDWTKRMDVGRTGKVRGWDAFWPALFGFLTLVCANCDQKYAFAAAAVCATASILSQSLAGLWPARGRGRMHGVQGVALGRHAEVRVDVPPNAARRVAQPVEPQAATPNPADATPAATPPPPPPPVVVEAAAPSFAGRRTHSGLCFLGKILLLAGLLLAVMLGRQMTRITADSDGHIVRQVRIESTEAARPAILALLAGAALLVLSRVRQGFWHLARACLGCGLFIAGARLAAGAFPIMRSFLRAAPDFDGYGPQQWAEVASILVPAVALLVGGLLFLAWPRRDPNKPIVI